MCTFCCCCSVAKLCLTLCDPMDYSMTDFPVLHYLPEFAQTHTHWVGDAIQPSHPQSHPFSSCPQSFPASWTFPVIWLLASYGQSTGASASASVLLMNIQDWSPLGWTDWISLQSKGLSRVLQHHSSKASILWRSAFFIVQLSQPNMTNGKTIALTRWTYFGKIMFLLFNMLSRLVIGFLPRSKHLLISCLQSPSAVILGHKKRKSVTISIVSPIYLPWNNRTKCHDISFFNVEF